MKKLIPFLSLIFLAGCSNNSTTLQVEFADVSGLQTGSPLLLNGLKVGEVKKFSVLPSAHILTEVELNPLAKLHQNDTFMIASLDLLGSKGIIVKVSNSTMVLDLGQVQKGILEPTILDTSFVTAAGKIFGKITTEAQLDSLEKEVKKLNKNVEELRKK
ncbi:MAG: transporter permease [Bacteroidetes bacterium]|nr:transporter permease [Bacteroidota bacterium]